MKKINKIIIERIPDYDTTPDWLGTFSNEKKSDLAITHEPENSRTLNWFNPCNATTKKEAKEDYERYLGLENNEWYFIGIKATAHTAVSIGQGSWKLDQITSGGLWGIESDTDEKYLKEIEQEQLAEVKDYLKEYGFTDEQINTAIVEYKD
jgi:hypothetical protein